MGGVDGDGLDLASGQIDARSAELGEAHAAGEALQVPQGEQTGLVGEIETLTGANAARDRHLAAVFQHDDTLTGEVHAGFDVAAAQHLDEAAVGDRLAGEGEHALLLHHHDCLLVGIVEDEIAGVGAVALGNDREAAAHRPDNDLAVVGRGALHQERGIER